MAASPASGVNTITGEGLAEVLKGALVVVDVSNSPLRGGGGDDVFKTSARNLLASEAAAGVGHHVALSVVGTERLSEGDGIGGYFRAKLAQEQLISVGGALPLAAWGGFMRAAQSLKTEGSFAGFAGLASYADINNFLAADLRKRGV